MTAPLDDETGDEFTELFDADFKRVDLVGKAANGTQFLIAKGQRGLVSPAAVRALVGAEAYHEHQVETVAPTPLSPVEARDDVTLTGSPGAIAKMIHSAAVRASTKEPAMTEPADVAKADGVDLEAGDVIADGPGGSTAESVPGSPDWETLDAETAQRAISVLGRAKAAVDWLRDREAQEAVTGDGDAAAENNIDGLTGACCALEAVIAQLGAFVAGETLEAELGDELEGITKAARTLEADPSALVTIEGLAPVVKAGRVLSSANEQRIRSATEQLEQVLASLPAPVDDSGQPVAKEDPMTAPATVDETDVEKAKGDPQVAVFDEQGKLVGTIDPKDLNPITKPSGGDAAADGDGAEAAPAEPVTEDELQPQPAAEAGTPAHESPAPAAAPAPAPAEDDDTVAKSELESIVAKAVSAALEDVTAGHAAVVKALEDRIDHLEAPAPSKVLTNGQLPPAHQMRGQDRGTAGSVDVTKAAELRDQYYAANDVGEREKIQTVREDLTRAALQASIAARTAR